MTLCIAASCRDYRQACVYDQRRIVVSADRQIQTDWASHNHGKKFVELGSHWLALFSGNVYDAERVIALYRAALQGDGGALTDTNAIDQLSEPFRELSRLKANDYCYSRLAISHERYLEIITAQPEAFREGFQGELEALRTNIDLLLVGWVSRDVRIYHANAETVREVTAFAIIGAGFYSAEAVLYRREQEATTSLSHTLYTLHEAHRLTGGFVPSVSREFDLGIVSYDRKAKALRLEIVGDHSFLRSRFNEFGPKPLDLSTLSDETLPGHFTEMVHLREQSVISADLEDDLK